MEFLHAHVFDRILESSHASEELKQGVRRTITRLEELDAAGMVDYYWSSLAGADGAAAFAKRMREEGFSHFEEAIDEFRARFGAISNFSRLPEQLESARKALHEATELFEQAEDERVLAEAERDRLESNIEFQRYRIQRLENRFRPHTRTASDVEIPLTLDNFADWCIRYLSGSVEMHNRAFQGVKRSELGDTALIYKALLVLRDYYVPKKREGGLDRLRAFQQACAALGITEGPTFSGSRSGEEGDTYFVRFAGRQVELDRHLKKGTSRDPRLCLRIYFFWDDEGKQVLVGWLPSHLATRIT